MLRGSHKNRRIDDIFDLLVAAGPLKASQIEGVTGISMVLTMRDLRALVIAERATWVTDEKSADPEIAPWVKVKVKVKAKDNVVTAEAFVERDSRIDVCLPEKDRPEHIPVFHQLNARQEAAAKVLRMLIERTPKKLAAAGNYSYAEAARLMEEIHERLGHAV